MNKCWSWINAHETSNGFLNREGERERQKHLQRGNNAKEKKKKEAL